MTGLETIVLLRLLAQGHGQTTGGSSFPFEELARIGLKLDAIVKRKGLTIPGEEALSQADRVWLLGDTVDAVMILARERGIDSVTAMQELKERHGSTPLLGFLERRVDALLEAEGIVPPEDVDLQPDG